MQPVYLHFCSVETKPWSAFAYLSTELASSHHKPYSARPAEYSSVSPGFDTVSEDQKVKGDMLKLLENEVVNNKRM